MLPTGADIPGHHPPAGSSAFHLPQIYSQLFGQLCGRPGWPFTLIPWSAGGFSGAASSSGRGTSDSRAFCGMAWIPPAGEVSPSASRYCDHGPDRNSFTDLDQDAVKNPASVASISTVDLSVSISNSVSPAVTSGLQLCARPPPCLLPWSVPCGASRSRPAINAASHPGSGVPPQ